MLEYLQNLSFWDWLALGTLLLIFEVFGTGGYLLWMAIAAVGVGVLSYLLSGLDWTWQLLLFAALSLASAWLWRRYQQQQPSDQPLLNRRAEQLLGHDFILAEAIVDGRGSIRVGDSVWPVTGPELAAGSKVRVSALQGVILEVIPLDHAQRVG